MFHVEQLIKENWNHHNFEKLKKKRIIKTNLKDIWIQNKTQQEIQFH